MLGKEMYMYMYVSCCIEAQGCDGSILSALLPITI